MKKLVLKLGAASLAVLPVVAVASCSTTTPNQTINTEVLRFEKLFMANESSKQMTTVEAKESINKAPNQDEKWNALNRLTQLPEKDSNFTYTVMDATIDKNVDSWLIVTMEITETTTRSNKEVLKLVIADLKPIDTALDNEAAKFNISSPANKESEMMKTNLVITNINNAKDNKTKLEILNKITTLPQISPEFSMEIMFAKPNAEPTSVDVMILITETASGNSKNATFTITGLVALTGQEKLEQQASLLLSRETLLPDGSITAFEAKKIITNTTIFNRYYAPVLLAPGVTYEFTGASVNPKTNTILDVTLTVSGEVKTTPIIKTIQLTGFTSPDSKLEEQAKFLVNKPALFPDGPTTALKAQAIIKDRTTLDKYYAPIGMADGISYEFVSSEVNTNNTILDVTLKVVDQFGTPAVVKPIQLSGFITPQQELIAASNKLEDRIVTGDLTKQTAAQAAEKINSTDSLVTYYPTADIGTEFSYVWKATKVVGDTVKVTVTVSSTVAGTTGVDKEIILSGFKTVLAVEAEKFAIEKAATVSTTKVTTAIRDINEASDNVAKLAALNALVTGFPTISEGFELIIGKASRVTDVTTSISVALTIKQTSNETEQVVNFTIITLTAETDQEELTRVADAKLITKDVLPQKAGETAAMAAKAITTTSILGSYYTPVTLLKGMTYNLKEGDGSVVAEGETVKVIVTVTGAEGTVPYDKEIIITGFTTPLDFEAKRFATSLETFNKALKTSTAIRELNDKATSAEKLKLINELVANFPVSAEGFTLTVGLASQNAETPTSINILLTITQGSGARTSAVTSKEVTFTITSLTSETAQEELERLANEILIDKKVSESKKTQTSTQAKAEIENDATLDDYYTRLSLGTGITYVYKSSVVKGDTLDVTVTVSSEGLKSYDRTFNIFGFRTLLEAEVAKFTTKVAANASSTKTTTVLRAINGAKTNDAKIAAINSFVNGFPTPLDGFTLTVGEAARAKTTLSSVEIALTITRISDQETASATFTITTLTAQANQQELEEQAKLLLGKKVTGELAKQTADQAANLIADDDELAKYYPKQTLLEGITYKFDTNAVEGDAVVINVIVSSTAKDTTPYPHSFKLTGFATPLQAEVAKFTTEVPAKTQGIKMQAALRSINLASTPQAKVEAIKALTNGLPEMLDSFTYTIGDAIQVTATPTSMSMTITIASKVTKTENVATFIITNLVDESLQGELESIATEYLGNKPVTWPTDAPEEIASVIFQRITDKASLETYYKNKPLPTGFEYTYVSNTIEGNSIKVFVKLTNKLSNPEVSKDHNFLITGFKTPQSAVEQAAVQLAVSMSKTITETTTTRQAMRNINDATGQEAKMTELKKIINNFPTVGGVTLNINNATVDLKVPTSINISITISPATSRTAGQLTVTFTITELKEESPQQELERLAKSLLGDIQAPDSKKGKTANEASAEIISTEKLYEYYPKVTLGSGITYAWAAPNEVIGNDVKITVSITNSVNRTTITHTFLIKGFPTALQVLAGKVNGSHAIKTEYESIKTNEIIRLFNHDKGGNEHPLEQATLLIALWTILQDFPKLSETGFVVVLGEASLGTEDNPTSVNIKMTISDRVTKNSIPVTVTITGLTAETAQEELERITTGKFKNSDVLAEKNQEIAAEAAALITTKEILETYYKIGFIHDDITYEFVSSAVSVDPEANIRTATGSFNRNSVKVNVIFKNTIANVQFAHSFLITGFKNPTSTLEIEAAKLAVSVAAKTPAQTTIQAIRSFMEIGEAGSVDRLNALKALVAEGAFPEIGSTFSLSITGASINVMTNTSIDVFITIHETPASVGKTGETTPTPATSMKVVFTITGLTEETPQQELDRIAKLFVDQKVSDGKKTETAAIAAKKINAENFHEYYSPIPKMPIGISYKLTLIKDKGNFVSFSIEISSEDTSLRPGIRPVKISGFKAPSALETEAVKLWTSVAATNGETLTSDVLTAINETATEQPAKLTALKGYVTEFPTIAEETYDLEIGIAIVDKNDPTSVNVPITVSTKKVVDPVTGEAVEQPVQVIFTITGLTKQPAK